MALRLLEVIIPEEHFKEVVRFFEESEITDFWHACGCESEVVFKAIMPAQKTEAVMDVLEKKYAHLPVFNLVLVPVEASFPSPKELEKQPEPSEADGNKSAPVPLRISRQELYNEIFDSSKTSGVYLIMVSLSTIVAAIGLLRDNTAVIIGAMVIAPLLGPNVALSLGTTLGDFDLGRRALKTTGSGILLSFTISIVLGSLLAINPEVREIATRTVVSNADIVLALASGIAGALSFTSGIPSALIGVMVAVALIPPLVVSGLLLGSGYFSRAFDAFLLLVINMICINIAGVITFLLQGIKPTHWWEAGKAKKATYYAIFFWFFLLTVLLALLYLQK